MLRHLTASTAAASVSTAATATASPSSLAACSSWLAGVRPPSSHRRACSSAAVALEEDINGRRDRDAPWQACDSLQRRPPVLADVAAPAPDHTPLPPPRSAEPGPSRQPGPSLSTSSDAHTPPTGPQPLSSPTHRPKQSSSTLKQGRRTASPPAARFPTSLPTDPPPPASAIHTQLARPNPPEPRAFLDFLSDRPYLISAAAVVALNAYAARVHDAGVRRGVRALLSRERLYGMLQMAECAAGPIEAPGIPPAPEGSALKPNHALVKRHPPLAELPARGAVLPECFLCHLHAQLLARSQLSLPTALETLRALRAGPDDELAALHLYLAYAPAGPDVLLDVFARTAPTVPLSRQTLHLALLARLRADPALLPPASLANVLALTLPFSNLHRRTPGPETWRHVAVHALAHNDEPLARLAFHCAGAELGRERLAAAVADARGAVRKELLALLRTHSASLVTGLDELALASGIERPPVADVAAPTAGKRTPLAMRSDRVPANVHASPSTSHRALSTPSEPQSHSLTATSAAVSASAPVSTPAAAPTIPLRTPSRPTWLPSAKSLFAAPTSTAAARPPAPAPPVRFRHFGQRVSRWERMLHALAERGWVERVPRAWEARTAALDSALAPAGLVLDGARAVPRLLAQWTWVGRAGEAGAAEREAARSAQRAAARAARARLRGDSELADGDAQPAPADAGADGVEYAYTNAAGLAVLRLAREAAAEASAAEAAAGASAAEAGAPGPGRGLASATPDPASDTRRAPVSGGASGGASGTSGAGAALGTPSRTAPAPPTRPRPRRT